MLDWQAEKYLQAVAKRRGARAREYLETEMRRQRSLRGSSGQSKESPRTTEQRQKSLL